MNQEIQYLKKYNKQEQFAFFIIKNGKKILWYSVAVIILVLSITLIVKYINKKKAERYIETAKKTVNQTLFTITSKENLIKDKANYYSEKERYIKLLGEVYQKYLDKKQEIETLQNERVKVINRKFKNGYLETFKPDKKSQKLLDEIQSVYDDQNKLIANWKNLGQKRAGLKEFLDEKNIKHNIVQKNTPYQRVKQKTSQLLNNTQESARIFKKAYKPSKPFQKSQIGTVNYIEIQKLLKLLSKVQTKYDVLTKNSKDFEKYYQLLDSQYYTKVIDQSVSSNTAYETEDNPAFREWTETESYQDTESYTETEIYSGTCEETTYKTTTTIVDGKAVTREVPVTTSKPCTKTREVTKTRPVTKTRTVTRDNGEPRTIQVPYTTFTFNYTVETTRPNGKSKESKSSGNIKLQGTSPSQPSYTYETEEQIGYIVWKEKWNDEIQRGFIKPYLK